MDIALLRGIGKTLLKEIRGRHFAHDAEGVKGAGGDRTYPIDKLAEEIILCGLKKTGEPLTVISEEAGVVELGGGGLRVVIDPIDGSRNAVSGIPFYCASIAVADGGHMSDVNMSYVINLISGEEFWAQKGQGAYLGGNPCKPQTDDALWVVAYECQVPHKDLPAIMPLISAFRRTRCLGATALDLAYLSSGAISVFVTPAPSRSFDFAGGWLLVKESGGIITDLSGQDLGGVELGLKRASAILASGNASLHEAVLRLLN